ncbi:MAG: hypothetical protein E7116_03795 [Bacteroidales bacterium]|nr:hypothetical protein [Bacteroidales bacterium]
MKSIFTKLSTLLLCGAVALVGCSDFSADLREVNERLEDLEATAATKAEVAVLKAEVEDLKKLLNNQYATKEDVAKVEATVEAVKKDLKDAQDAFTAALDNKADKTALEKAVNDIQTALETAKGEFKTALEGLASENETLKGNLQALVEKVEKLQGDVTAKLETIDGNIETLQKDLQELTSDVDEIQKALDSYKETVDKELEAIKEGFDKRGEELDEKFGDIDEQFTSISDQLTTINNSLTALATADTDLAAKDKEIEDALKALQDLVNGLEIPEDLSSEIEEINGLLSETSSAYNALATRVQALENALGALEDRVETIEGELKSIVAVPQVMVNGLKAVEFKSLTFVPMAADSDEVPSVEGAQNVEFVGLPTYAYYHFNPSSFNVANAEYAVVGENVEFVTKAAADVVAEVKSIVNENGKVKVELVRGAAEANMFALVATYNGNEIYSDYVQIIDAQITAEDIDIVNNNNEALYATLADAQNNAASAQIKIGESHNVAEHVEVLGVDFADYSLSVNYTLVEGEADFADGVVTATEAAAGTDNIIKVELVDNDGCVVRRAYVKVRVQEIAAYYVATAKAQVEAQRVAFEVSDIAAWAKALKDEPNTMELIKNAIVALKDGNVLAAYEYLGGVPGFVKKYQVFSAEGEAKVKVENSYSGMLESLLPDVEGIDSVEDLKVVVEKVATAYPEVASKLETPVTDYIPSVVQNATSLPIVGSLVKAALNGLADVTLNDVIDTGFNVVEKAQQTIEKYTGYNILDYSKIRAKLIEIVSEAEEKAQISADASAEALAKTTAQAEAKAKAVSNLITTINAANDKIVANLENGTWGQLKKLLDNDITAKVFETLKLTDVYNSLMSLADYAEALAQWDYEALDIEILDETCERVEVLE